MIAAKTERKPASKAFYVLFYNICPVRHMNFTRNYRWVNGHEKQFTYKFRLLV